MLRLGASGLRGGKTLPGSGSGTFEDTHDGPCDPAKASRSGCWPLSTLRVVPQVGTVTRQCLPPCETRPARNLHSPQALTSWHWHCLTPGSVCQTLSRLIKGSSPAG